MKAQFFLPRSMVAVVVSLAIILFSAILVFSGAAAAHPELYAGITYDLVIVSPLIFFLISRHQLPLPATGLCVAAGLLAAWFLIPSDYRFHLNLLRYAVLPFAELFIIFCVFRLIFRMLRSAKEVGKATGTDLLQVMIAAAQKVTGSPLVGRIIGSEMAMIGYAFGRRQRETIENSFSYHEKSGTLALLLAFSFLILIEAAAIHLLVARSSVLWAWILTGLSLYSFVFLIAHIRAIVQRPHILKEEGVLLRNGMMGTLFVSYGNIASVSELGKDPAEEHLRFYPMGGEEKHNVTLYFNKELTASMLYGFRRQVKAVTLQVDDAALFVKTVSDRANYTK